MGQDVGLDPVPVQPEQPDELTHLPQGDSGCHPEDERLGDRVVIEKLLLDPGPAVLEGDRGGDLVEDIDSRGKMCLDRVGGQDPLRERVQGPDGGQVQLVECSLGPLASYDVFVAVGDLLELGAQSVAKLCSGLDRERHGRDGRHGEAVVEHQVRNPADE